MKGILYIGNFLGSHLGFYSGPNQWLVDSLVNEGFKVRFTSSKLNKARRLIDFVNLLWSERKKGKLVFIDTYSTQAFYFSFVASYLCNIFKLKYILVLHGGNLPDRYKRSHKIVKWMFANASCVVAPSKYLYQASVDASFVGPIVIPNPIPIKNYKFTSRARLRPHLLWVRSMQDIYNPSLAIDIVAEIKKKQTNVKLTMVGPDKENMLPSLKEKVNFMGLESNVHFTGKLSVQEWTDLSINCDIFLNTTNIDNTPVSVLEAMALGLPVVSTNVGGIPYILNNGHDALLCESGDVESMVVAINQLLQDSILVQHLCLNARAKIENHYNGSIILAQWLELIRSI